MNQQSRFKLSQVISKNYNLIIILVLQFNNKKF